MFLHDAAKPKFCAMKALSKPDEYVDTEIWRRRYLIHTLQKVKKQRLLMNNSKIYLDMYLDEQQWLWIEVKNIWMNILRIVKCLCIIIWYTRRYKIAELQEMKQEKRTCNKSKKEKKNYLLNKKWTLKFIAKLDL